MRVGTMSILLAVFACISILNMLGVSALSTERTYFDRYKNNWDFLVTVKGDTYSEELLNDIRNTEDVAGCIVHRIVNGNTQIPADYLSSDVQKLSLENSTVVSQLTKQVLITQKCRFLFWMTRASQNIVVMQTMPM